MKTINVDEAINLNIEATQDTDFKLTLQFSTPFTGGMVKLDLAGLTDTIEWIGALAPDGRSVTFGAKYDQVGFATGVYRYCISYEKTGSRLNLFTGNFTLKPRL